MTKEELLDQVQVLDESKSIKITPRELLGCFGLVSRSKNNNIPIKQFLSEQELFTYPDFTIVYMDALLEVKKKPKISINNNEKAEEIEDVDPVARIQILPSANRKPITTHRDAPLNAATTKMLINGYSQLPVMNGSRSVDGIITWETIGNNLIHGGAKTKVRECMSKDVTIISNDTSLFEAVKIIIDKEVVLIKNEKEEICGIVTTTDIGEQFVTMSEPFLILEQIENHIRKLLKNKFSREKLMTAANEEDTGRQVESINDLTFGEYVRLLENPTNWNELKLNIDRDTFIKQLEAVRRIRNDVMHFHPDGISDLDFEQLRKTSLFFENLAKYMS